MHDSTNSKFPRWLPPIIIIVCGLLAIGATWFFVRRDGGPEPPHPSSAATEAGRAAMAAGRAAMAETRFDVALTQYQRAESQGVELPANVLFDCAQASLQLGKTAAAEKYLRRVLVKEPEHLGANEIL